VFGASQVSAHAYDEQQRADLPVELRDPLRLLPPPEEDAEIDVGSRYEASVNTQVICCEHIPTV